MEQEIIILTACIGEDYVILSHDERWSDSPYICDNKFQNPKILPFKKGIYKLHLKVEIDCERDSDGYIAYEYETYKITKIEKLKKAEFEIYTGNLEDGQTQLSLSPSSPKAQSP